MDDLQNFDEMTFELEQQIQKRGMKYIAVFRQLLTIPCFKWELGGQFFLANMTSGVQPTDQEINKNFKDNY